MVIVEVVVGVLFAALLVVATALLWIGLLGILGALSFRRCEQCRGLELVSATAPPHLCLKCRHEHLFHPVLSTRHAYAVHHPTHRVQRRGRTLL